MDSPSELEGAVSPTASLRSDLEGELLRGVRLELCLAGWGRHFSQSKEAMYSIDPEKYKLSQQTDHIDNFLSHDWASGRSGKFLTLLWISNIRPAILVTFMVSCLIAFLREFYWELTGGKWRAEVVPLLIFIVVLCFWQRMRALLMKGQVVFLDRLCIAQYDPELKQKGISALAGFLRNSSTLTVLWSPRWITRLWCVYELATYLSNPGKAKSIRFVPVTLGASFMSVVLFYVLIVFGVQTTLDLLERKAFLGLLLFELALVLILTLGIAISTLIETMHDFAKLAGQIKVFRVQESECFCCSNNHRHPHTGRLMQCDRDQIYQKIQKWCATEDNKVDQLNLSLERFNTLVQEKLSSAVLEQFRGGPMQFSHVMEVACVCIFPDIVHRVHFMMRPDLSGVSYAAFCLRIAMQWSINALALTGAIRAFVLLSGLLIPRMYQRSRFGLALTMAGGCIMMVNVIWVPFWLVFLFTEQTSLLPAVPYLAAVALNALLWQPCLYQLTLPEYPVNSRVCPPNHDTDLWIPENQDSSVEPLDHEHHDPIEKVSL